MPAWWRSATGLVGVALIAIGVVVLGTDTDYGTHVFVSFSLSHGLHESDVAGSALVGLGTLLVWIRK